MLLGHPNPAVLPACSCCLLQGKAGLAYSTSPLSQDPETSPLMLPLPIPTPTPWPIL